MRPPLRYGLASHLLPLEKVGSYALGYALERYLSMLFPAKNRRGGWSAPTSALRPRSTSG
ncbi:MAG: hypothetical protein ACLQVL_28025 [Terriglobia bacterium]